MRPLHTKGFSATESCTQLLLPFREAESKEELGQALSQLVMVLERALWRYCVQWTDSEEHARDQFKSLLPGIEIGLGMYVQMNEPAVVHTNVISTMQVFLHDHVPQLAALAP